MEDGEVKAKQTKKRSRRTAGASGFETLRAEAVRQLKERLEGGDMSTGDLMKVITMSAPEPEPVKAAAGDWVLDLQEDV